MKAGAAIVAAGLHAALGTTPAAVIREAGRYSSWPRLQEHPRQQDRYEIV